MNTKKFLATIFAIAFVFLAVASVMVCSFAPISTAILLVFAAPGITYLIAKKAGKREIA
ncbi:MAG: hypothetical protein NWE84_09535 [Candidatus Bathyarchaeota archaeon]|nr:hypothetical protein [Candidatus Bathyarchaeota archaeon]